MSVAKPLGTPSEEVRLVLTPESSMEQKSNPWEQERDVLLEMVSKNQWLLRQAQETWHKEKEDLIANHQSEQQVLQKKLTEAHSEIRLLHSELRKSGTDEVKIRVELLKELERLEFDAQSRESDLNHEIKTLKNQLHNLQASLAQNKNRICDEKKLLQTQLDIERNDSRKIQIDMQRNLEELHNRCEKANKEVYFKTQEMERLKRDHEAKLKSLANQKHEADDSNWSEEKKDTHEGKRISMILKMKEQTINSQLQSLHQEKANIEKFYAEKIQGLEMQNRVFRKKYQDLTQTAKEKEEQLHAEVKRLSLANSRILTLSQQRENKTDQDYQALSTQLKIMQNEYQQRENSYLQETSRLVQCASTYEDLLKQHHEHELKGTPAADALRNELDLLQTQLSHKEEQLSNLRELYLGSKHNERRTITKAISSVQTLLEDIRKQQKFLLNEECNYTETLRDIEQQSLEREKQHAQKYHELCSELNNLRKEHQDYKANNWEMQIQELTEKNVKLKQEIDTARVNIINNHQIIQELQKTETESPINEHIHRQQIEINMLNSENQCLVENMNYLENYYKKEISNHQSVIERKNYQLEQVLSKSDRARTNKAKRHLDEIASWQSRQLTFTKTIKNLENKLKALTIQEEAKKKLSTFEVSLETEELKLLRNEVGEKEDWIDKLKCTFEEERKSHEKEVHRLREVIYSYRHSQDKKIKLLSEEHSMLKNNREMLLSIADEVKNQMEILSSNNKMVSRFDEKFIIESEEGCKGMVEIAQEQVESLKKDLVVQQELHQNELEQVRSGLTSEVNSLKEVEGALNNHIQAQQEEIDQLTRGLTEEKQQHNEEIQALQTELQSLKRVNAKRHDLMRGEKDNLVSDITRLLGMTQHKEGNSAFLDKISEIYCSLEEKSFEHMNADVRQTQEDTSPSEIDISKEILYLKNMELEREKQVIKERETLHIISQRLQKSVQNVLDYAQAENENIAKDLEMALKKLKTVQMEKENLKRQRDELVNTLSKARTLSKTDRGAVTRLIDQMKSSLSTRKLLNKYK